MQKIKCYTRDQYVNYYASDELVMIPEELKNNKKEFRGVWVSTVENIDIHPFESKEEGMKQLDDIVETCKAYTLNAIIFQVRPTNDALYESELNPFSKVLSKNKVEDENPGFDPLAYLIEKASKYNIEVHAWMNPYRVTNRDLEKMELTKDQYLDTLSEKNFARKRKDLVLETSGHHLVLDPASKEVQDFLVQTVLELANKYDIKAVHIDDYFYPYDEIIDPEEDDKNKKICPYLAKADFRRYNVNEMIRKVHEGLKTANKKVEFGISPFAVYRTNSKYFENGNGGWYRGSHNMAGSFQAYEGLYSDVYLWMKEGWIDYVCPQDYFAMDNHKVLEDGKAIDIVKYADVVRWWNEIAAETKTRLYIGMAIYRITDEAGFWQNEEELFNQLKLNQTYKNVKGFIMFTYHNFTQKDIKVLCKVQERLKKEWNK